MLLSDDLSQAPAVTSGEVVRDLLRLANAAQRGQNVPVPQAAVIISEMPAPEAGGVRVQFAFPCASARCAVAVLHRLSELANQIYSLSEPKVIDSAIQVALASIANFCRDHKLVGVNTPLIFQAAHEIGLPTLFKSHSTLRVGTGKKGCDFSSSATPKTLGIGLLGARSKKNTATLLRKAGLPGAIHEYAVNEKSLLKAAEQWGFPLVIKPDFSDGGKGVSANIRDNNELLSRYKAAREISSAVLVERHVSGYSHRASVIDGEVVAVTRKRPIGVLGDGVSTIRRLVESLREQQLRAREVATHHQPLIEIDEVLSKQLNLGGMSLDTVPDKEFFVPLRNVSNSMQGGTTERLSDHQLHPDNIALCRAASAVLNLDVAGIDVITEDFSVSWRESNLIICEINGVPQLGLRTVHELLRRRISGNGNIRIGLLVYSHHASYDVTASLKRLADDYKYDDIASQRGVIFNGLVWPGRFENDFSAAEFACFDSRASALIFAMSEQEIAYFGLPVPKLELCCYAAETKPQTLRLIKQHCSAMRCLEDSYDV